MIIVIVSFEDFDEWFNFDNKKVTSQNKIQSEIFLNFK